MSSAIPMCPALLDKLGLSGDVQTRQMVPSGKERKTTKRVKKTPKAAKNQYNRRDMRAED